MHPCLELTHVLPVTLTLPSKECQIELPNDNIQLQITNIRDIRETAKYSGYRLHIRAKVFTSLVDVKIDVTTERADNYGHKLLLKNRTIAPWVHQSTIRRILGMTLLLI